MLFLILVSLLLAVGFLFAFFKATKDGQFEDDYTPAVRILFDDGVINAAPETDSNKNKQD